MLVSGGEGESPHGVKEGETLRMLNALCSERRTLTLRFGRAQRRTYAAGSLFTSQKQISLGLVMADWQWGTVQLFIYLLKLHLQK